MAFPASRNTLRAPSTSAASQAELGGKGQSRRAVLRRQSEDGYMLLTAVCLLALLVISLAVALPSVTRSIQRDRDLETYHRGMQYRRAIQLYYRKFHAFPPNAGALFNTNEIHFLRKKYNDPLTGKNDWKPVMFGQNKAPVAMGFFGEPLGGNASTIAGIGPGGGLPPDSSGPLSGSTTGQSGTAPGSSGSTTGPGSAGTPGASAGSGDATDSGSSFGSGQTFGGAGIIGFSPASDKQSILVYKKKNHYNEWEFTYDPISDMRTMSGGNAGGNGLPPAGTPGTTPQPPVATPIQ